MVKFEAEMSLQDTGKGQLYTYFPDLFKKAGLKEWEVGKSVFLEYDTDKDEIVIRRRRAVGGVEGVKT